MRLTGTFSGALSINSMRQAPTRTRFFRGPPIRPQSSGARPVSVARAGQRGQRTTAGQEEDKTRPQSLATEVGQRVQGRGQSVWPAIFI